MLPIGLSYREMQSQIHHVSVITGRISERIILSRELSQRAVKVSEQRAEDGKITFYSRA